MEHLQKSLDLLSSLAPWQGLALMAALALGLGLLPFPRQRAVWVGTITKRKRMPLRPATLHAPGVGGSSLLSEPVKEPDIVICAAPTYPINGFETLPLDAGTKAGIGQLLRCLPGACFTGARTLPGDGGSYILKLSPRIAKGIGAGSVAFLPALRVGAGATGLGALQASAPKMVALEMAAQGGKVFFGVWHVLAIVTAQKLLHDIGRRISTLEFGLRAIKQWLENQLYGSIEGNYLHLRQIVDSLQGPELGEKDTWVFSIQVEAAERELRQSSVMLKRQLEDSLVHLRAQHWNGPGLEENYLKGIEAIGAMERWSQALLLAIHVRAFGAGVRGALGLSQEHSSRIIVSLLGELEEFARLQGLLIETFGGKVKTLRGRFTFNSTDGDMQRKLKARFAVAIQTTKSYYAELYDGIKRTEEALTVHIDQQTRPLVLRVTVNGDGEIKSTEHLTTKAAA